MVAYANKIAARYMLILSNVAEMAEGGELVSDLSHSAVRACLAAMNAAGSEPIEIYHMFGDAIKAEFAQASPERQKYRDVLDAAYTHLLALLLRKNSLVS